MELEAGVYADDAQFGLAVKRPVALPRRLHTNLRTGERYYNHARSLQAFRTLQTHILERRRQARSRHDGPNVNALGED